MPDQLIYTLLLIITPMLISRLLLERALKTLDDATKLRMIDGFAKQRRYSSIIMFVILVGYFLLLKLFPANSMFIIGIFGMLFLMYFVISRTFNFRKIAELGASEYYLKMYKISTYIVAAGFLGVGLQLFWLFHQAAD